MRWIESRFKVIQIQCTFSVDRPLDINNLKLVIASLGYISGGKNKEEFTYTYHCFFFYRWLYWTDWGQVAKIERISMDGKNSSRQTLHNTGLAWPNALTIDYSTQTLYWADAQLNKIETSSVDGSNRRILTTNILHPFGLTYHSGYLYWSDWQTDQITMTHVSSPDNVSVLVSTLDTEPMGLEVVATSRQPIGECMLSIHMHAHHN